LIDGNVNFDVELDGLTLQKKWDFWTVLNRPEIGKKKRLEKGPDGFFWTV
jgi:hypothetical protein